MNVFITSFAILVLVFQVTMTHGKCIPPLLESCAVLGPQQYLYRETVGDPCSSKPGFKWCCPRRAFHNSMTPPLEKAYNDGCRPQQF
ncbi:hypothetical protein PGTUg99_032447 [Puccinia graminis f. sp. tritici]|uniref:Uncharacterized protein n=1 Tax=Puccinia graminis f. sp. tritici TaxID=56615 RepID=A0A5B0SG10_PUCGR|nr:hypothetical protein PGTUg99_032447 [Puccinia graminis f. sp. tritici]